MPVRTVLLRLLQEKFHLFPKKDAGIGKRRKRICRYWLQEWRFLWPFCVLRADAEGKIPVCFEGAQNRRTGGAAYVYDKSERIEFFLSHQRR